MAKYRVVTWEVIGVLIQLVALGKKGQKEECNLWLLADLGYLGEDLTKSEKGWWKSGERKYPTLCIPFQVRVQGHHAGSMKPTMVGVLTPWKLTSSVCIPGWILNIFQHSTGLKPTSRVVRPEEGDREKTQRSGAGVLSSSVLMTGSAFIWVAHSPYPFRFPMVLPTDFEHSLPCWHWKSTWIVLFLVISISSSQVVCERDGGTQGVCPDAVLHDFPPWKQRTSFRAGHT